MARNSVESRVGNITSYDNKGRLHKTDGPAVEFSSGTKYWYINGELHREDGPAVEYFDGSKIWWYNNECIGFSEDGFTQEDFERFLKIKEYW